MCGGALLLGILTENYAGAFPLWIAPTQVRRLPASTLSPQPSQLKPLSIPGNHSRYASGGWVLKSLKSSLD